MTRPASAKQTLIRTWDSASDDDRLAFWKLMIHKRAADVVRIDNLMRRRANPRACRLLRTTASQLDLFGSRP